MQHRSEPRTGRHCLEDQTADSGFLESAEVGSHRLLGPSCPEDPGRAGTRDSWPLEETHSIRGQRQGWIAQSFCVIKFYKSIKEIEKASDIGIRRGQKSTPFASISNGVIYSPMNPKNVSML